MEHITSQRDGAGSLIHFSGSCLRRLQRGVRVAVEVWREESGRDANGCATMREFQVFNATVFDRGLYEKLCLTYSI